MRKLALAVLAGVLAFPVFGQTNQWKYNLGNGNGIADFSNVFIGDYLSNKPVGEGTRLYLQGLDWNGRDMFLQRVNSSNYNDLRVNIGGERGGIERFLVGNTMWYTTNTWQSWLSVLSNGNVGIGTDNPYYKLDVNGVIRAREVIVNLSSGADFVFEPGYQLKPLDEVHSFIKENKHLPEIPTAAEMTSGDTDLGELQVKLLQKIEELTLYVIQQQELIDALSKKVEKLENENK